MENVILAEVTRSGLVESIHRGAVAVADNKGNIIAHAGNVSFLTYIRSAAKPVQALPVVESGAASFFGLNDEELALIISSHNGEAQHVRVVQSILNKIGLSAEDLQCGIHPPLHPGSAEDLLRQGLSPTVFHSTCSGKHAGMLALAQFFKWPLNGYYRPDHPVQQLMLQTMADFAGLKAKDIPLGVDGCGVPVFALSLAKMATVYARWANPSAFAEKRRQACFLLQEAMTNHPFLIAGHGRLASELMKITGNRLLAKDGTESVFCVGIPRTGWGIAVKIEDGNPRALGPVVINVLEELGLLSPDERKSLENFKTKKIKNNRGETIGEIRAAFQLENTILK